MIRKTKLFLFLELFLIYLLVPLLFFFFNVKLPSVYVFFTISMIILLMLLHDKNFSNNKLYDCKYFNKNSLNFFLNSVLVFVFLVLLVYYAEYDNLFLFPLVAFNLWFFVVILFGVFIAYPMIVVYYAYFYYRYKRLFDNNSSLVFASSLFFAFAHILFYNVLIVVLAFIGGLWFGYRYQKSKSVILPFLEYLVFGILVFTIGVGYPLHYFL